MVSADKILDSEMLDQSYFESVFYWAQAVKRQLDALLTIPDQIVVQNLYKLLCSVWLLPRLIAICYPCVQRLF